MIGIPIAMWSNGKKSWTQILTVWILTLAIVGVLASAYWYYLPIQSESYLYIAIFKMGIYLFILFGFLAMWLKIPTAQALKIVIIAVAIDFIIASLIGGYLLATGQWSDWIAWFPHLGFYGV